MDGTFGLSDKDEKYLKKN